MRATLVDSSGSGASRTTSGVGFAASLGAHGDRLALALPDGTRLSYAELDARVGEVRGRLGTERRLVLVEGANRLESTVTYLAALAGGHPVLVVPPGDEARTGSMVDRFEPDVVQRAEPGAELQLRRDGTAHDLHPELALLLSTSGSTGSSKLVRLSRRNVESNAEAIAQYLALEARDRAITSLPLHYCYGLSVLHTHLLVGGAVALTEASVVDPCFWTLLDEVGVTGLSGVPHTFDLLERVGFDEMELPTLRYLTQAGGRLAPEKVRHFARHSARRGRQFFVMYGQTEATARMAYLPPEQARSHPDAIGVPIPGGSFTIDAPHGATDGAGDGAGDDGPGELVYRGPNVMLGYALGPEDLALGRTVHELRTGDLARRGPDGLYRIVGRASRFIKPFGVRIDLDAVEALLGERGLRTICTGDDERLAVGVEHRLCDGPGDQSVEREVREAVRSSLGLPPGSVAVHRFETLPRLANGKPDYDAVRRAAERTDQQRPVAGRAVAGRAVAEQALPEHGAAQQAAADAGRPAASGVARRTFGEVLGLAEVRDDDTFVSLGGDSLSYVEASMRLERELGYVPRDWHLLPVAQLDALPSRRRAGRRRPWRRMETNVVLRAVAIVLVVCTHGQLFKQQGGAHLLFALAGFNFARFQLAPDTGSGTRGRVASIARVAVPTLALTALAMATREGWSWSNALLVHNYVGGDGRWWYWYVEALLQVLAVCTVLFAIPAARRFEQAHAFLVPLVAIVPLLGIRAGLLPAGEHEIPLVVAHVIAWLFVLGWAAQRATTLPRRLLVSALTVAAVPGLFGNTSRELIVGGGVLLAMWVPRVVVPSPLHRVVGVIAGASLYTYLTHFFVVAEVRDAHGPAAAVAVSLALGVLTWLAVEHGRRWVVDPIRASVARRRAAGLVWRSPGANPSL